MVFRTAAILLLSAGSAVGQKPAAQSPMRPRTLYEDLQLFSQVLNQIRVNHPDSVDQHALLMAAIEGMISATDPHSYVIPAFRLDSARQRAYEERKLAPVPIAFVYSNGAPIVLSVGSGTAAARQDILVGDELVAIDSQPVAAQSPEELEITLAGVKGTTVALRLLRRHLDGSRETLVRVVRREREDEGSAVPVARMLDSTTGYVRVSTFDNERVADEVHAALQRLERGGMRRLVLDLRDNGGGYVAQAADVAGEFLPKGSLVYTAKGRKEAVNKTVKVSRSFWRSERSYPVVVLVNRGTASASELVAGALQDHDRALIVGRPTFGKALLMQGMPLTDGSTMMLVVGHVTTPCGRVVQRTYRGVRSNDYWREAGAVLDTAGRPSCRTDSGRIVYGGGGIYPDVVLKEPTPVPLWVQQLRQDDLLLKWAGALNADSATRPTTPAADGGRVLSTKLVEDFRGFAHSRGRDVPAGADADAQLRRALLPLLAYVRDGNAGYYAELSRNDSWITEAVAAFGRVPLSQQKP